MEADVSNGLPAFHMVGYLFFGGEGGSRRVRTAIRNSGLDFQLKKTVGVPITTATMKEGRRFEVCLCGGNSCGYPWG